MSQPPTQLSPDGKYYWDGQKWLPVPQPQLAQAAAYPPTVFVQTAPTNTLAVVSLVAGILSWVLCPFVASVVAVICGHLARSQIRRTGEGGGGIAIAGLILGYLSLAGTLVFAFISIVFFGGLFALLAAIGAATPTPSP